MKKYVQITAGRGPVECARVVTLVVRKMQEGLPTLSLTDFEPHNNHTQCFMSVTLAAEDIPAAFIRSWEGSVLWVATKNPFRPNHKRKNWFVGVHFFDETELPTISESDIQYETCRSGGKGGQHVNKVETAVRAIYKPSGLAVKSSDERSQQQNKKKARERLILKLHQLNVQLKRDSQSKLWNRHSSLERGDPVKKFSGPL